MNLKKYEGHNRGPWKIQEVDRDIVGIVTEEMLHTRIIAKEINPKRPADNALMADAPLLLKEVKRLREQLAKARKFVHNLCQHSDSMMMDYEDYMKED